jgi:hypothetical protein
MLTSRGCFSIHHADADGSADASQGRIDLYLEGFWEHASKTPVLSACAGPLPWVLAKRAMSQILDVLDAREASGGVGGDGRGSSNSSSYHVTMPSPAFDASSSTAHLQRPRGGAGRSPLPRIARPMWMSPSEAFFLQREDASSDVLAVCLGRLGMPTVLFDSSPTASIDLRAVARGAESVGKKAPWAVLTPQVVREYLSEAPPAVLAAALDRHSSDTARLLAYAISDGCDPVDLLGFPVPLSDGTTTRFQRCSAPENEVLLMAPSAECCDAFSHAGPGHRLIHGACAADDTVRGLLTSDAGAS